MAIVVLIFSVYFAAVLETALAGLIEVRHVVPDLLAMVAVIWLLVTGRPRGFLGGCGGRAGERSGFGRAAGDRHGGVCLGRIRNRLAARQARFEPSGRATGGGVAGVCRDRAGRRGSLAADFRNGTRLANAGGPGRGGGQLHGRRRAAGAARDRLAPPPAREFGNRGLMRLRQVEPWVSAHGWSGQVTLASEPARLSGD